MTGEQKGQAKMTAAEMRARWALYRFMDATTQAERSAALDDYRHGWARIPLWRRLWLRFGWRFLLWQNRELRRALRREKAMQEWWYKNRPTGVQNGE